MKEQKDVKKVLIGNGFRVTKGRIAVLTLLSSYAKPIDVDEIYSELKKKKISTDQVTIYRTLDAFVDKGMVTRLDFHEGKFRYELAGKEHHHAICENCGQVDEVTGCELDQLEKEIAKRQNFFIKRHALEFFGLCANCQ